MEKLPTIVTMLAAIIAAFTGLWGTYTTHDSAKFQQPFVKREELVKSFKSEIESSEARNDRDKAESVRRELEEFEKLWRDTQNSENLILNSENKYLKKTASSYEDELADNKKKFREIVALVKDTPQMKDKIQKIIKDSKKEKINRIFYEDLPEGFLPIEGVTVEVKEIQSNKTEKMIEVRIHGDAVSFEVEEKKMYRIRVNKDGYKMVEKTTSGKQLISEENLFQLIPLNK